MGDVAIIKESSLILDSLIGILKKHVTRTIHLYDLDNYKKIYRQGPLPEFVFVDMNPESYEPLYDLISFCQRNEIKVVVWASDSLEHQSLIQLFQLGLSGYFYPEMEREEIIYALRQIAKQQSYIHPELSASLLREYLDLINIEVKRPEGLLTKREWEVLELISRGRSTKHISEDLFISTKTVTNHTASILRKLQVNDRTNAALLAVKNRWILL